MSNYQIAIVGRPNVGKSTFFNRLLKQRKAIVGSEEGITRDRIYGEVEWSGHILTFIDTGGYIPEDVDVFNSAVRDQALAAVSESDLILFMVDGKNNPTASDKSLARLVRQSGKKFILAVNKCDSLNHDEQVYQFHELGIDPVYPVSALNGRLTGDLLDSILEKLEINAPAEINDHEEIFTHNTDPILTDTDGDELEDGEEINDYLTEPLNPDSDGDELGDGLEITIGINPLAIDSDSDGLNDTWEYTRGSQGYNYNPGNNDTDGDGVLDGDEDLDTDGLTNLEEINTYGTNDNYHYENSHVIPALLRKVVLAKKNNDPFVTVWGSGKPRRDFLNVDDLANACYLLMKDYDEAELINIGSGNDISITELINIIIEELNYNGKVKFDKSKPDGTMLKLLDLSLIHISEPTRLLSI